MDGTFVSWYGRKFSSFRNVLVRSSIFLRFHENQKILVCFIYIDTGKNIKKTQEQKRDSSKDIKKKRYRRRVTDRPGYKDILLQARG